MPNREPHRPDHPHDLNHPDRLLPLQGASNFRDLGGYTGLQGRPLRWRRLFRSDHLGNLTPEDHGTLVRLGITRAFDFRGVHERAAQPYALAGLTQHSLAIEPSVAQEMQALAQAGLPLTPARMEALMQDLYTRLVTDNAPVFADWFAHLLDDASPLVFHCTAGKDRTGIAAALLLRALGVAPAVVEQDYLLTNLHYQQPAAQDERIPADALAVLWSVRPSFLHTALARVDADHGGLEPFLTQRMHLSAAARAKLAAQYLED
jgi:protein-tyrosine phosphatase